MLDPGINGYLPVVENEVLLIIIGQRQRISVAMRPNWLTAQMQLKRIWNYQLDTSTILRVTRRISQWFVFVASCDFRDPPTRSNGRKCALN